MAKTWESSNSWEGPTKEGLGHNLKQLVKSEPEQFVLNSEKYADLSPIYVDAILSGVNEAIKDNVQLPWGHILNICQTYVNPSI